MAVVCAAVVVMIVGSYRRSAWLGLGWIQNGDGSSGSFQISTEGMKYDTATIKIDTAVLS
jgi:hypothetical protein